MKTNNNNKLAELSAFYGEHERNLLFLQTIIQRDEERLFFLLTDRGLTVTPFLLNLLIDFDRAELVDDVMYKVVNISPKVYDWLVIYWGQEETDDFFCNRYKLYRKFEAVVANSVPSETLKNKEMWNFLIRRGEYELVPLDVLAHFIGTSAEGVETDKIEQLLLERCFDVYAPKIYLNGNKRNILSVKGGPEYLLEKGEFDLFLEAARFLDSNDEKKWELIEKALELKNNREMFKTYESLLLEHRRPNLSVTFDSTDIAFLSRYPQLVNWDRLWQLYPDMHAYLHEIASRNPKVNAEFLRTHSYTIFERLADWWRNFKF